MWTLSRRRIVSVAVTAAVIVFLLGCGKGKSPRPHTKPYSSPRATSKFPYVASSLRVPFHRPSCEWARKIDAANLQTFSSREEAIAAGHKPCKVRRP